VASYEIVGGLLDDESHIDGLTQICSAHNKAVVLQECKNMNSLSRFEPQYQGNFCSGWLGVKEGDIVYHAFYKYGKVIEISGDFIQILFNGENRARKFHRTELFETLILRETV
jgi:hypothetical protein